jgi:hypothetical protein
MTMPARSASKKKQFAVGTKVRFKLGGRDVEATVIEDRGSLGIGGAQLLRVRLHVSGTDEVIEFEVPATEVRATAV